ncbi:MAG: hypothetical protein KDD34_03160 [Bdellovibrionales bacterium]|nr:hypothetical protein [Bdellovibrionales bacterium]
MKAFFLKILLLFTVILPFIAKAGVGDGHPGYVSDVEEERLTRNVEMNLVSPPVDNYSNNNWVVFDDELTKEFQHRYEERFGRSDAERNIVSPGRFDQFEYQTGVSVSVEEDQKRKRVFGEFMMKRLTEHHLDQYAKSKPAFKSVYELKEKISNATVEVQKGYKVRLRYSYSGNYLLLRVENPYEIRTAVTMEMDPSQFGPSEVQETILSVGYSLGNGYDIDTHLKVNSGDYSVVGSKSLAPNMAATLTAASYSQQVDRPEAEDLILLGFTWNQ